MASFLKYFLSLLLPLLLSCGGKNTSSSNPDPAEGSSGGGSGSANNDSTANPPAVASGNFLNTLTFPHEHIENASVKDVVPALTDPQFVLPGSPDAAYLDDTDLVIGVHRNGVSKAYPIRIGWYHEIINDIIGGQPIAVTFSPLTDSGVVFGTTGGGLEDRIMFGVTGQLFNNNLIMYDRNDDQIRYPQMTHVAISGFRAGWVLTTLPFTQVTWGYWKRLYPDTMVISGNTPEAFPMNDYGIYPYGTYRNQDIKPRFPTLPPLDENPIGQLYPPKSHTFGVRFTEKAKAYPYENMGEEAVINDNIGSDAVLVVWFAQEKMAIAFNRNLGSRILTFTRLVTNDPVFPFLLRDEQTGTTWDLKGRGIAGQLANSHLLQIPAHSAFWFAWASFWQDSEVYTPQ
jgi:hypothetical protein